MSSRTQRLLMVVVGAGLAIGLGLAAQQQSKPPETELERVARRAWQDLEEGQSETYIASAVQARVETSLPSRDDPDGRRQVLLEALDSEHVAVRWTALVSLHHYGAPDTPLIRRLIGLSRSPIQRIRVAAATMIGALREVDDEAAGLLGTAASNEAGVLRANALRALARARGGEPILPQLLAALADDEVVVRRSAAYGIARIDMESGQSGGAYAFAHVVSPLRSALRDEDAEVRAYAAMALGRMASGAAPAVPDLIQALVKDDDNNVRSWAATALGNVGAAALPALEAFVGEPNARSYGFWALKLVGDAAVPVLRRLLEHELGRTRIMAARTLWDMEVDRPDMIGRMMTALAFDDVQNQGLWMWDAMLAMEGLARAGKEADVAKTALRAIASNEELDDGVRDMARDTLKAVAGDS